MKEVELNFYITKSFRRSSVSISVHPERIKVKAPFFLSNKDIDSILNSKMNWIQKKIKNIKENNIKNIERKKYTDGETFFYIGNPYCLTIIESEKQSINLKGSTLVLLKKKSSSAKNLLKLWFKNEASRIFLDRLDFNFNLFLNTHTEYPFPALKLRLMKSRWGSMSSSGEMTLNTRLVHLPINLIDYVIMHELCHLVHKKHNQDFYKLNKELVPDYKNLKKNLEYYIGEIRSM